MESVVKQKKAEIEIDLNELKDDLYSYDPTKKSSEMFEEYLDRVQEKSRREAEIKRQYAAEFGQKTETPREIIERHLNNKISKEKEHSGQFKSSFETYRNLKEKDDKKKADQITQSEALQDKITLNKSSIVQENLQEEKKLQIELQEDSAAEMSQKDLTLFRYLLDNYREKCIFAVASFVTLVVVVAIGIKICEAPARELYDRAFGQRITVKSADEVALADTPSGVQILSDDISEFEKYQLVSKELFDEQQYSLITIQTATASSERAPEVGAQYDIARTYDQKVYTDWEEDKEDNGMGETLTFQFDSEKTISGVSILNGNGRSEKAYRDHNRAEMIMFQAGNQNVMCSLEDTMDTQYIKFEEPFVGDSITLILGNSYEGDNHKDITCISEIGFYQ